MKKSFFAVLSLATAVFISSCSDSDVTSTSPQIGELKIQPSVLYTGQTVSVNVSYSTLGEHVYFSSGKAFTCNIKGNGYDHTDSILVSQTGAVTPHDFSFKVSLPPTAGTYSVTVKTPVVNKSSAGSEGDAIFFPALSVQKNISVKLADAINANFGDSRETVAGYITVSDTTFDNPVADALGKASVRTTTSDGLARQLVYKFSSNRLSEVDDEYSYTITGIIRDENGNVTSAEITDDDASKVLKQANILLASGIAEEWLSDEYAPTTAKATYGSLVDEDSVSKWKTFLTDLIKGTVNSYSFICPQSGTDTMIKVIITSKGNNILITNKYTE